MNIYKVDPKTGFTIDGYPLGKTPRIPDPFQNPAPLPRLNSQVVRTLNPFQDQGKYSQRTRIASFDEQHVKVMRRHYGDPEKGEDDGARITWATKIEQPEPETPQPLTPEEIAQAHGQETLRRLNGRME